MNTKILFILISLLSVGCAKQVTSFNVDPALMPYYQKFIDSGKSRGTDYSTNDLVMQFGETQGQVIGYCRKQESYNWNLFTKETVSTPVVVVKPSWWANASEASKRELVYHELGHCLMNKEHNTSRSSFGQPESIMYPYHIGGNFFSYWEANYLDQLFGLRLYALSDSNGSPATAIASTGGTNPNASEEGFDGIRTAIYASTEHGCEGEEHFHDEIIEFEDEFINLNTNEESKE